MRHLFALPLLAALPVFAEDLPLPLVCTGLNPDWGLEIRDDGSTLSYQRIDDMDLAWETQAEGADWPRALTLIGRGTSAIVVLDQTACDGGDLSANVLTQQGETPLLLTGCCQSTP